MATGLRYPVLNWEISVIFGKWLSSQRLLLSIHSFIIYPKAIIDCLVNANDTKANKLWKYSSCHGVGTGEGKSMSINNRMPIWVRRSSLVVEYLPSIYDATGSNPQHSFVNWLNNVLHSVFYLFACCLNHDHMWHFMTMSLECSPKNRSLLLLCFSCLWCVREFRPVVLQNTLALRCNFLTR